GQAAYLGVGAYLTAILATKYGFGLGWGFWLVVVLGILIGAATAAFFGLFAIRAGGVYFLMITLALGQCVWGLAYRWNSLTGGDGGLAGVLWAHANGHVSPEDVVLTTSVDALLMVVLGGSGTLIGGAIGAGVVVFVREYLSTLVPWWQYVLGGLYVLAILYL